jgi:hypothetical protein
VSLSDIAGVSLSDIENGSPQRKSQALFCEGSSRGMTVAFEQAAIKVQKEREFARLQGAVEQAFLPAMVERFLKQLDREGIRVRDFEAVLAQRVLEGFGEAGLDARQLYGSLPVSDQALMREFYLSKLEGVDIGLRHKFKELYQYY